MSYLAMRCFSACAAVATLLVAACSTSVDPNNIGTASPESFLRTDASIVVVDFFDMYCHSCQTEAPHVMKLERAVQKRSQDKKVQFYAVGWGNSPLEAETYRTQFNVPFPVIPDRDLRISKRYGSFRPPLILALRREGGSWKEFYRTQHIIGRRNEIADAILR